MKAESRPPEDGILSDEAIVELYFARNEDAIAQTARKYGPYLHTVAQNIVHDPADSDSCLSDTYLAAWQAIPPDRPQSLRAYLTAIVRRIAVNFWQAGSSQKRLAARKSDPLDDFAEILSDGETPESALDAKELGRTLSAFVRGLSRRRRYVFMSRYYLQRPLEEIARTLGCSLSTVNKDLSAIRRDLREKLEKEGYFV